jgi:hypothetical protein
LSRADGPAPRTLDEVKKALAEIAAPPEKKPDAATAERQAALRRLKAYRYLSGVPHDDLVLDDDLNAACDAGARLCEKLGRLEHTPKNPGWPEDEFRLAYRGTSQSNLGFGYRSLVDAMDGWMDDSDDGNIDRVGHRRWCLNPAMRKVGFGKSGQYYAMHSFDRSRKEVPDFDLVSFPGRGLMPVEYFKPHYAWSVSLNPKKYNPPPKSVTVKVYPADDKGKPDGEALELNYSNVDTVGFGIPNCIIFRPEKAAVAPGKRYVVEIEGVTLRKGGEAATVRFAVEFVSVK